MGHRIKTRLVFALVAALMFFAPGVRAASAPPSGSSGGAASGSQVDCSAVSHAAQDSANRQISWAKSLYQDTIGKIQNKQIRGCIDSLLRPHFNFGLSLPHNLLQQLLGRACAFAGRAEQNAIGQLGINVNAYSPLGGNVSLGANGPTPNSGYTPFQGGYSVSGSAGGKSAGTSSSTDWLNVR